MADELPGGISPPGLPKPCVNLDSHGSRCSTVGRRAAGFTSSTGSSCCQLASVGRWSRLNNAAPSVQLHYRAFVPTTSHSAPVLRIGTLVLAVLAACDFSLYIGAQVLTFRTKAWLSFAPPPCRIRWAVSGISQANSEGMATPRFWHRLIRFRHVISGLLALASLNLAGRDLVPPFPQRSPPSLLTTAACGGLRSTPNCRPRRALLHLSYSTHRRMDGRYS